MNNRPKPEHTGKYHLYVGHTGRTSVPSPFEMTQIISKFESEGGIVTPGFVDFVRKGVMRQPDFVAKMGWSD